MLVLPARVQGEDEPEGGCAHPEGRHRDDEDQYVHALSLSPSLLAVHPRRRDGDRTSRSRIDGPAAIGNPHRSLEPATAHPGPVTAHPGPVTAHPELVEGRAAYPYRRTPTILLVLIVLTLVGGYGY